MSFSELGLRPELLRAVAEKGYDTPTLIQAKAIPAVLSGCDVLAGAYLAFGGIGRLNRWGVLLIAATGASLWNCERIEFALPRWIGWAILMWTLGPVNSTRASAPFRRHMLDVANGAFLCVTILSALWWAVGMPNLGRGDFTGVMWHSMVLGPIAAYVGILLWIVGFTFEAVADWQLARFKADPSNRGRVLDHGLWRYSRHPNYFGNACLWWGLWLIACDHPIGIATVFSPVLMTHFLLNVTGKKLLEKRMSRARPEYADYVARTPGFFPWFPRRS